VIPFVIYVNEISHKSFVHYPVIKVADNPGGKHRKCRLHEPGPDLAKKKYSCHSNQGHDRYGNQHQRLTASDTESGAGVFPHDEL